MNSSSGEDEQERIWIELYDRLRERLEKFGTEDVDRSADSWIHDENWGTLQHKVYIRNLALLRPNVVKSLQQLLLPYPDWEIVVAVSVPGPGDAWPDMGLTIRAHEIIDGLKRQYFPKEFQDIRYEGSRPGTEND